VAARYGLLRSEGVSERALVYIDKKGIIRDIQVSDINKRPDLESCATTLEQMNKKE
jgi:peroxiredoxin (alkyl hydroperoxide reductase subunit C)